MEKPQAVGKHSDARQAHPQKFETIYRDLKRSIVAIVAQVSTNPEFPDIVGTGFVVREDGFVLTCRHVLDAFQRIPRRKDAPKRSVARVRIVFPFA
jgi:S1-C subfamily serine protease